VRKALRADDLLKDTPTGPLVKNRQNDLGSRHRGKNAEPQEEKLKAEPIDMEIDMEVDDLPPGKTPIKQIRVIWFRPRVFE
jgi:hypothetical protein